MNEREYVKFLLESMGISRCYNGHDLATEAILAVMRDETALHNLRKRVFMPLAERLNSECCCIERAVRTAIQRAWQVNEAQVRAMAAYPLATAPTVKEFIEIVYVYILRSAAKKTASGLPGADACGCAECSFCMRQRETLVLR